MGVPALFRWLTRKYPKIISSAVEEQTRTINGYTIPIDIAKPNPNGFEVDNLYLDMNGIIHPCTHPEDRPPPETEDEAMMEIFNYIDRIMAVVRPRKLLYMAIDGVAPRAKMNQQRSRRFRAAQEAKELEVQEICVREALECKGQLIPAKKKKFDSNCITPGTPFMARLAECLRYFAADRISKDSGWANIKVILSDASVPGEGEHKIMDFIRRQRHGPRYDPNTRHVLHGLDADLIMLALATHEPHFKILREDVFAGEKRKRICEICGQPGHQGSECLGIPKEKFGEFDEKCANVELKKPFVFLHVSILREYLEFEMQVPDSGFPFDLERALDDWVFMCFFVGNDFLPHLASLEIREGAVDKLITIYKRNLRKMGGYLTDCGEVDLSRVQVMMRELGSLESEIFRKRHEADERREQNRARNSSENRSIKSLLSFNDVYKIEDFAVPVQQKDSFAATSKSFVAMDVKLKKANESAARTLRENLFTAGTSTSVKSEDSAKFEYEDSSEVVGRKRKLSAEEATVETVGPEEESVEDEEDEDGNAKPSKELKVEESSTKDDVRLWESGWRERYYRNKFDIDPDDMEFRKSIVISYTRGLCWVLKYYYQGCQSWQWFFPYNYAPFAMDFASVDLKKEVDTCLEYGAPFRPFEQLMAVLPAASKDHIPACFWPLMTENDSPILEYYPEKFRIDLNGKKHSWQGVIVLPFIDEKRLLEAMSTKYEFLSANEKLLNSFGSDVIFVGKSHVLYEQLCELYKNKEQASSVIFGLSGTVKADPDAPAADSVIRSPLASVGLGDITCNHSMRALFFNPDLPKGISAFKSKLLANVRLLPRRLDREDFYGFERRGSMQQAGHYEQHESRRFQSYGSYNEAYNYQISRNQQSWQNQYNYSQSQDYSNQRHNPYYQQQQQNSYYSNQRHLPYYQQQKQNNNYPNQRKY